MDEMTYSTYYNQIRIYLVVGFIFVHPTKTVAVNGYQNPITLKFK